MKAHPLKITSAQSYFAVHKWCKINYISYYLTGFIVCMDYVMKDTIAAGNPSFSAGINSINGRISFIDMGSR